MKKTNRTEELINILRNKQEISIYEWISYWSPSIITDIIKKSNQHDYYDCYKPDNNICNFIFT